MALSPLTIIGLIPEILRIVPFIQRVISQGLSLKTITDMISSPELKDLLKQVGEKIFPDVRPDLQGNAAASALYAPDYVMKVQNAMNELLSPSPNLEVDGRYGALTQAAVKQYQHQKGLVEDGWVGDASMAAMMADLAATPAKPAEAPVLPAPKPVTGG